MREPYGNLTFLSYNIRIWEDADANRGGASGDRSFEPCCRAGAGATADRTRRRVDRFSRRCPFIETTRRNVPRSSTASSRSIAVNAHANRRRRRLKTGSSVVVSRSAGAAEAIPNCADSARSWNASGRNSRGGTSGDERRERARAAIGVAFRRPASAPAVRAATRRPRRRSAPASRCEATTTRRNLPSARSGDTIV
jgi:hypothetical protein